MSLASNGCLPCQKGAPRATAEEINEWLPQVPEWKIQWYHGIETLQRVFGFPNFVSALEFTNRIGALAEDQGHHPALLTEWGRVTVSWWTHKIGGLHHNDFIMAAKTDEVFERR